MRTMPPAATPRPRLERRERRVMSAIAGFADRFKGQFQGSLSLVRTRLFGANNEKLDSLMDRFYKLIRQLRSGVLAPVVGGVGVLILMVVWVYFAKVNALKKDLSNSFAALHELMLIRAAYDTE